VAIQLRPKAALDTELNKSFDFFKKNKLVHPMRIASKANQLISVEQKSK